jgi:phospholipid-translocating ATPase
MTIKSSDHKRRSLLGRLHAKSESQEKNGIDMEPPSPTQAASAAEASSGPNDSTTDLNADVSRMLFFNVALPPELVNSDGHPVQSFPRNKIRTAKYTPVSFIPKNLWFQFHNVANIFFLFLVILVFFPIFGGVNPGLNAVPLIIIIAITSIKDAYEDYQRTVLDIELNNAPVHRLCNWNNVNVEEDNVSDWRKFKKANSRLFGWIWLYIQSWFSPKAKDKRKARKQAKLEAQSEDLPRPSVESRRTRASMALNRASMQLGRHSLARDDIQYKCNLGAPAFR